VALGTAVVIGLGLVYMFVAKPHERGSTAAGDAITAAPEQARDTAGA
jgi:hypothetical protein